MCEEQHQGLSTYADTSLPFQPVPGSEDPRNGIFAFKNFVQVFLLIVFPRQIRSLLVISPDP